MRKLLLALTALLVLALAACSPPVTGPWPPINPAVREYRIGPGDVFYLSVVPANNELTRESTRVTVRPDGRVSLPMIGEVGVAGRTVAEADREIGQRYGRFLAQGTIVNVVVQEVHSYRIYVLGKVNHPGDYESRTPITVLQALSLAGGPLRTANTDAIVVLHREPDGSERRYMFSYDQAVGGRLEMNFYLATGDTVVVP